MLSDSAESDASSGPFRTTSRGHSSETRPSLSSAATTDCIRDAVMCMLRRTTGVNLPDLTRYLSAHFPDIPSDWRVPIIISTFSSAQKVAATYAEAVLGGDDDRMVLAKKSMTRWIHGLSTIEPGRPSSSDGESHMASGNSSCSRGYSPTTKLPVGSRSSGVVAVKLSASTAGARLAGCGQ